MRRALLVLAALSYLSMPGCTHHDIDCFDDWNHNDPQCLSDAIVSVEDAQSYVGETIRVTVSSGTRSASKSGTIGGPSVRFTFEDFIREGGGAYTAIVHIDLNHDGGCDNPPVDAVWTEDFDDDDTEWVMDLSDGMDPACN